MTLTYLSLCSGTGRHQAAAVATDCLVYCCRWQSAVLVAGSGRREAKLLGRLPLWSSAVLLQPGGELHRHELLLQLWRRYRRMVHSADTYKLAFLVPKEYLFSFFAVHFYWKRWFYYFVCPIYMNDSRLNNRNLSNAIQFNSTTNCTLHNDPLWNSFIKNWTL